jgi:hypothetical protein
MPRNKESTADFMKRLRNKNNTINLEENREISNDESNTYEIPKEIKKPNSLGNGIIASPKKNAIYIPQLKKKNVHKNNIVLII